MKNIFFQVILAAAIGCTALFACKNEGGKAGAKPVVLETITLNQKEGRDCDKPDTLREHCAEVKLAYPKVKEGNDFLKKGVKTWSSNFLTSILSPALDSGQATATTLDAAVKGFFKTHQDWTKEEPEALAYYSCEAWDTVLLNDGKHLTLKIDSYTFTGGAHGSPVSAVGTFEVETGKILTWSDLITDTTAVKALAEKKFREVKADIFKPMEDGSPGFDFDDTFRFTLPANYGLTSEGIYFCYLHYEVTPYAYGSTEFVIPFAELGKALKNGQ